MEEGEYYTPYNVDLDGLSDADRSAYLDMFVLLPQSIKDILIRFSTAEYIEEKLGHDFILNVEQKRGIARVIRDALLGDLRLSEMGNTLAERYGVAWQAAKDIAQKIQIQLFTSALDDIKKIQQERFGQQTTPAPSYSTDRQTTGGGLGAGRAPAPQIPSVYQPPAGDVNPENVVNLRNPQP